MVVHVSSDEEPERSEPDSPAERLRGASHHVWERVAQVAQRHLGPLTPAEHPEAEDVVAPPPEEVLDLLRHLGVAMARAGDATERVTHILGEVAAVYAVSGVTFFVVPTGVFVRIESAWTPPLSSGTSSLDT